MSGQILTTTDLPATLKPKWPGRALACALLLAALLHLSLIGPGQANYDNAKSSVSPAPAIAVQLQPPTTISQEPNTPQAASQPQPALTKASKSIVNPLVRTEPQPAKTETALIKNSDIAQQSNLSMPDFMAAPDIASSSETQVGADVSNATGSDALAGELPFYPAASLNNASLKMQIQRQEPGKNPVYGEGELTYSKNSDKLYQIELRASLSLLFASINLYQLSSQGQVVSGQVGFQPIQMNEKRRNRAETATHFDAGSRRVTFSSSNKTLHTSTQVQDKASFLLQLSAIALANPEFIQVGQKIHLQVAEEREMSVFSFEVLGQETLQTKAGVLLSWHLRRPAKPGAYNSVLDIWLAPAQQWLPVQIRNTEANGAVTTQTVTDLKVESTN